LGLIYKARAELLYFSICQSMLFSNFFFNLSQLMLPLSSISYNMGKFTCEQIQHLANKKEKEKRKKKKELNTAALQRSMYNLDRS